jgi:hypothetical protein
MAAFLIFVQRDASKWAISPHHIYKAYFPVTRRPSLPCAVINSVGNNFRVSPSQACLGHIWSIFYVTIRPVSSLSLDA